MEKVHAITPQNSAVSRRRFKLNNTNNHKNKTTSKKMIRHLIHPDYILFDWEFFSNALEFE